MSAMAAFGQTAPDAEPFEVFLQPGEFYFGDGLTRIRTLLGSCVAITVWHSRLKAGGMCHYMLPGASGDDPGRALDGRYSDDAMQMFLREIRATRRRAAEFEVKLFGGGSMFGAASIQRDGCHGVPCMNVQRGRELIRQHGLLVKAEHFGGEGHRNIHFEVWSGDAYVKFWGQDAVSSAS
jgi:chemotaxis protein CheD